MTEFTFLDEEITAFQAAGVNAYVLSTSAERDHTLHGVEVRSLPQHTWRGRMATVAFLLHRGGMLRPAMLRHFRETGYYVKFERLAAELIRTEKIDLVHSMFGWPGGFGGVLARRATSAPLIANFRGMDLLLEPEIDYGMRTRAVMDAAIRLLLRNADRTLYPTAFMREQGIALGAEPATAVWIPKGVDIDRFSPSDEREQLRLRLGCEDAMILCVCNLIARKGVDMIIRSIARLRDAPAHTLYVCGDGPERSNLERLARDLEVADRVRFLGYVERSEIAPYFAACDVFVLASIVEAAGNVVLEAMASGRPVVCTASGGPTEYVNDGANGFVVPLGDDRALSERLSELLRDPTLADAMGRRGRSIAVANHPYRRMVQDTMELYEMTLHGSPGRRPGVEPSHQNAGPFAVE